MLQRYQFEMQLYPLLPRQKLADGGQNLNYLAYTGSSFVGLTQTSRTLGYIAPELSWRKRANTIVTAFGLKRKKPISARRRLPQDHISERASPLQNNAARRHRCDDVVFTQALPVSGRLRGRRRGR